jgi:hypothetical protein
MRTTHRVRPSGPRVLICRGCCCGTVRKHPTVDHDAQVTALHAAVRGHGSVATVDCLGRCDRSNVVVVKRSRCRALWIGPVLDDAATDALARWLQDGAPDPVPAEIDALVFERRVAKSTPVVLGRTVEVAR